MVGIDKKRKALAKELFDLRGTDYNAGDAAERIMGILDTLDVEIKEDDLKEKMGIRECLRVLLVGYHITATAIRDGIESDTTILDTYPDRVLTLFHSQSTKMGD